jgi:hypothetical protein
MKYLKQFLVFLVFTFTFAGLVQSVDARGADEPCSYLSPTKYVRDSGGNCVLASSGSSSGVMATGVAQTGVSQARSTSEPCSYLSPTKYIRDSSGNCVVAQQRTVQQVAPASVPASAHTTTIIHVPSATPVTANSFGSVSDVAIIALLGIVSLIAYKIFGVRFRQPRIKYRPRQHTNEKSEDFAGNESVADDNSSVQETTGKWNGDYYDEGTLEKSK